MTDLFLHHYPASLFSEKIRSLLGYCALEWNSVQINNIMPRPNLMELSGGYRKTPILQDGASVFCDTKIIAVLPPTVLPSGPIPPCFVQR